MEGALSGQGGKDTGRGWQEHKGEAQGDILSLRRRREETIPLADWVEGQLYRRTPSIGKVVFLSSSPLLDGIGGNEISTVIETRALHRARRSPLVKSPQSVCIFKFIPGFV